MNYEEFKARSEFSHDSSRHEGVDNVPINRHRKRALLNQVKMSIGITLFDQRVPPIELTLNTTFRQLHQHGRRCSDEAVSRHHCVHNTW